MEDVGDVGVESLFLDVDLLFLETGKVEQVSICLLTSGARVEVKALENAVNALSGSGFSVDAGVVCITIQVEGHREGVHLVAALESNDKRGGVNNDLDFVELLDEQLAQLSSVDAEFHVRAHDVFLSGCGRERGNDHLVACLQRLLFESEGCIEERRRAV